MFKHKIVFVISITVCFSCTKSIKDENIDYVKGCVYEVDNAHIGKGKYKRIAHFEYTYSNIVYKNSVTSYFKWQGNYHKGDSILIRVSKEAPTICKIQGKIKHQKKIVNKLQSKTK